MKELWNSDLENPALFLEYAMAHFLDHYYDPNRLPDGFLETARRLEPDNSWPTYIAAAETITRVLKVESQTQEELRSGVARQWKILDQGKLDHSLRLVHEATMQSGFETHISALYRNRIQLIPRDSQLDHLVALRVLDRIYSRGFLGALLNACSAKSRQFAQEGDREAFLSLLKDAEIIVKRWADSETDGILIECQLGKGVRDTIPNLHSAAVSLGLTEEAGRLNSILERIAKRRNSSQSNELQYNRLESHYSMLLANERRYSSELPHPPWTPDDLEPGRLSDHELLSRAGCLAAWLFLGAGLASVFLFHFRLSLLLKRVSARIESLLRPVDRAWIIGLGVLLPYGFAMFINRFTLLGARDLGIFATNWLLPSVQFLGMTLLMGIASVRAVRWRLEKRAGVFLPGGPRFDLCMRATFCAALFIPVSGLAARNGGYWLIYWLPLTAALLGFPLLWLFVSASRALFDSDKMRLLARGVIARALVPVYAVGMLLMVVAAPVHDALERFWFRKDKILRMDPAYPTVSPYEYKTARILRNETRAILGLDPYAGVAASGQP